MSLPSLRGSSANASDPIETASLDELRALQLARLKLALAHAATIPHYRKKFSAAGVAPGDLKNLDGLKFFPFTNKDDLRQNYPFGMFAVPQGRRSRSRVPFAPTHRAPRREGRRGAAIPAATWNCGRR